MVENPVLILGAKGLGQVALEIFNSHGLLVYGFLEDDETWHQRQIDHVSILGRTDDQAFLKLIGAKCEAFVASDENQYRKHLTNLLLEKRKVMPLNAIHAQAYLAQSVQLGHGNLIGPGAILNAGVKLGSHSVVHACALIDYGSQIADYVQIGAGSVLNSEVVVEEEAFIGSGVTVVAGVKIGKQARVGAGSVVIQDIAPGATVFGNPAQVVK
ncbi:MAG: acetyltransferase [Microscillaceae bacterium]